jgi:sulfur carrier protein
MSETIVATIMVNGATQPWCDQSVAELVAGFGAAGAKGGVAVAVNAEIVPRGSWANRRVRAGDRVEIVRIVRGG